MHIKQMHCTYSVQNLYLYLIQNLIQNTPVLAAGEVKV